MPYILQRKNEQMRINKKGNAEHINTGQIAGIDKVRALKKQHRRNTKVVVGRQI